jgi:hypothetical protein
MAETESITVQMNAKQQDTEEMIKLFLKMSEVERAKVFGYEQGIESMMEKLSDKQSA